MKDTDLRGIVLRKYYNKRRVGRFNWVTEDFDDLPESVNFDEVDLYRICDQLAEHGLIEWKPIERGARTEGGFGKISAFGVDVVEGATKPPIAITLDQSVNIHGSSHVQIGNNNTQDVSIQIDRLVEVINNAPATDAQKAEAKSLLKRFLEHPLVASIAGALASQIKL